MSGIKVKKYYHPNGQLRWEGSFQGERPEGSNRQWHENGVLKEEHFYERGLEHGVIRQWNQDGKLLGEYTMKYGTGTTKRWHENGQLESELSHIDGQFCGRHRVWFEDGVLAGTEYYIWNRKVSKKKYIEACKTDPVLPRYDQSEPESHIGLPSTKYRRGTATSDEQAKHDQFITKFRSKPNQKEARQWLAENENRNLGELAPEDSRELIEEGYKAGALKIIAVEIQDNSTNCLIVELPPKGIKRKRVFEWNNELAQNSGFDPDADWGQNELFVFFD
jgi:uncharacterized protein YeaO (DUF488 family)